ncbi:Acetylglutamate kinase [Mucinivorans hirudinis]|uniref:Acetylglutamate kinase n=1 Tax=Mucinivorans hirudinis TaxID=1433126 RepID=A0A060R8Y0_9BACT|nr:Acetylglutamate kinase [Mucinivorans hirudinis]
MEKLKVIKIGGNIVDDPTKLERFISDFAKLEGLKILVHGGGKVATTIGKSLGIETTMINGRRVTDRPTLDVVTMVYAGLINKNIVAQLQAVSCNAIGLCGVDGAFINSRKRSPHPIDYGFVGDPVSVNIATAKLLLGGGVVPVIAPITGDMGGTLLNTNADTVAQTIATGLAGEYETELVYCFEKRGVLENVEDENSVIRHITPAIFEQLKAEKKVADGMLPKLENAFKAVDEGVERVVICAAEAIGEDGNWGTVIGGCCGSDHATSAGRQ